MKPLIVALILALAASASLSAATCESLRTLDLPHTTLKVVEAREAGPFTSPYGGRPLAQLPAFCRVAGTIQPTPDSDIRFEVWLPASGWNGKFVGGGNGVWAGSIAYGDMVPPMAHGYATAASDVGHQGSPMDGTFFAGHPEKLT